MSSRCLFASSPILHKVINGCKRRLLTHHQCSMERTISNSFGYLRKNKMGLLLLLTLQEIIEFVPILHRSTNPYSMKQSVMAVNFFCPMLWKDHKPSSSIWPSFHWETRTIHTRTHMFTSTLSSLSVDALNIHPFILANPTAKLLISRRQQQQQPHQQEAHLSMVLLRLISLWNLIKIYIPSSLLLLLASCHTLLISVISSEGFVCA